MSEYTVKCKECGKIYLAGINRAGYCETCRTARAAATKHKYYEKRKEHNKEVNKELVACVVCGKRFNPVNALQLRCSACQRCKEREAGRQATYKNRREKVDCIQFRVPKGEREKLKAFAEEHGMSLTEFILEALEQYKSAV